MIAQKPPRRPASVSSFSVMPPPVFRHPAPRFHEGRRRAGAIPPAWTPKTAPEFDQPSPATAAGMGPGLRRDDGGSGRGPFIAERACLSGAFVVTPLRLTLFRHPAPLFRHPAPRFHGGRRRAGAIPPAWASKTAPEFSQPLPATAVGMGPGLRRDDGGSGRGMRSDGRRGTMMARMPRSRRTYTTFH